MLHPLRIFSSFGIVVFVPAELAVKICAFQMVFLIQPILVSKYIYELLFGPLSFLSPTQPNWPVQSASLPLATSSKRVVQVLPSDVPG